MDPANFDFSALFPNIAAQMRSAMGNLHLAAAQLIPASEREQDPELDAKAALLDQSYYQLLRLVNNLTAAGCLEQAEPLPLRDQDLVEAARTLTYSVQGLAELLGIQVDFHSSEERHICAFHLRSVEQLLYQLLSNALKFTPAGGAVTVECKPAGRWVLLSVTDTGCGLEEEELSCLFSRYLQADLQAPQPHGLGLGLAICQHIAESHGGTMMAESRPGQGARFTFSMPDRRCGNVDVSDVKFDYSGGFNPTLLALADALPPRAFALRQQD